ncbi:MAG: hypothetical protein JXO72_14960 [Vicinamibacteria bacterium]|nr:hypothetical protein [Vicinamibacteria bacterium]
MARNWRALAISLLWIGAVVSMHEALNPPGGILRVDLGAGDEAHAGGFPGGWEAHERRGKTTYRWTGKYARIDLPVARVQGKPKLNLRFARFTDATAQVAVHVGARSDSWIQGRSGWREREIPIDSESKRFAIHFHSSCEGSFRPGIALDWIEIREARSIRPRVRELFAMALLIIAVPGLLAATIGRGAPLLYGSPLLLAGCSFLVRADPLGGLTMCGIAGPRAFAAAVCLVGAWRFAALGRKDTPIDPRMLLVPVSFVVLAASALSYPRFHYPDVDTHARFLKAIRSEPSLAIDPTPFQRRNRTWTRFIDGRRVGFPYSSAFHVLAWPWAPALGEIGAIKVTAVLCVAMSILLVNALAFRMGAGRRQAVLAQCVFVFLPVTASRLSLALYPSLLGQMLEIALLWRLITRLDRVCSWREATFTGLAAAMCQIAYTGSLMNVGMIIACLLPLEIAAGSRRRALWLGVVYFVMTVLIITIQYHYFLPALWREILPNIGDAAASPDPGFAPRQASALTCAAIRLRIFYGALAPLLALVGLLDLRRASRPARRVTAAALVASGLLAWLRFALPAVFQDVKEVELLAAPSSVLIALGLGRLSRGRGITRWAALAGATGFFAWGAWRAVGYYLARIG